MFVLSDLQERAVKLSKDWWNGKYKGKYPFGKVFILGGIAGAGKTSVNKIVIKELGLEPNEVLFCAYTGMASSVLTRKGTPAKTIHKTIYNIARVKDQKTGKYKYIYRLKEKEEMEGIKLIVVDEWSMVPGDMLEKLLTFDIPIYCMGDYEQVKPIGKPNGLENYIDFFLDEPHRQALEDPIFWVANQIRLGNDIDYGNYGGTVKVVPKLSVSESKLAELAKKADQVIAGKNATVQYINALYRAYHYNIFPEDGPILPQPGEKLMCLKNNWGKEVFLENGGSVNLVNGIMGIVEGVTESHEKAKVNTIDFRPIFTENHFEPIMMDNMPFLDNRIEKKSADNLYDLYPSLKHYRLDDAYADLNYFDFGYGCTAHKYQGSECGKLLYIDEVLIRKEHKHLQYTAVTRAKDSIIMLK